MKIDFGDVSVAMRNFLRKTGNKKFNPGSAAAMAFLNAKDPTAIKLIRKSMIEWGYKAQRFGTAICVQQRRRPLHHRPPLAPAIKAQIVHFFNKAMPGNLPKKTARALLDIEDASVVPVIRDRKGCAAMNRRRCSTSPAAVPSACSVRSAWQRRRCCTTSAPPRCCRRLSVLRLSADRQRQR